MRVDVHVSGTEATITVAGWLETQAVPDLQRAVEALDPATTSIILDLADLEYISSSGLRQIVAMHKRMRGNLTLRNVPADIMEVLRMAGFDRRLNIEA